MQDTYNILHKSGMNHIMQDFCMDLEQESWQVSKILASSKSWHGFGTDFLPTWQILPRSWQDFLIGAFKFIWKHFVIFPYKLL